MPGLAKALSVPVLAVEPVGLIGNVQAPVAALGPDLMLMLARNDLDERGVTAAGVPITVLPPERFAQAKSGPGKKGLQQPVTDRSTPFPGLAKFGLAGMVMVGDRGMITSARIAALNQREDGTARPDPYRWITALRAPAIRKLMAKDGPLQLSLSGEQDLAEITSPDFPGERLIACRNPVLAADRARTREDLLAATEKLLAPPSARVRAGRLTGAGPIGLEAGKVISRYKTAKHFRLTITDTSPDVTRKQEQIDVEAALDGFYVLRTPVPAAELDAPFRGLLEHLATLTRNQVRFTGTRAEVPVLAEPTRPSAKPSA
ncbi:MAG: hypothetical protein ACRDOL_16975 [Streptosporangiaceae bacterium]